MTAVIPVPVVRPIDRELVDQLVATGLFDLPFEAGRFVAMVETHSLRPFGLYEADRRLGLFQAPVQ